MQKILIILHDIRSSQNVGAIFRTADGAGVSKIYLTGYTPAPVDRFGRKNKELVKASLGAEEYVQWEQKEITELITELKKENVQIVAVEQSPASVPYMELKRAKKTAFIFGNEVEGISEAVLQKSDAVIEIPMRGKMVRHAHHPKNQNPEQRRGKESLNVSVTAGIILFHVTQST